MGSTCMTYTDDTIVLWQNRARAYAAARGWAGAELDDLVSEMLVELLTHDGEKPLALQYLYLHARDTLNPRRSVHGERVRQSAQTRSLDASLTQGEGEALGAMIPDLKPSDPSALLQRFEHLPPEGAERAMMILSQVYGFTMQEIGVLFGVSQARISQRLTQCERERTTPPPQWEGWVWLTL